MKPDPARRIDAGSGTAVERSNWIKKLAAFPETLAGTVKPEFVIPTSQKSRRLLAASES
jgi:hypothetical protein